MAYVSLEGSLRTCKVDVAWANRMESDRFFNPNAAVCPTWNGVDTTGRPACMDSFATKRAGCHSATDRVSVENDLRPKYMQYVTLNAAGIRGDRECAECGDVKCNAEQRKAAHAQTGQFGMVTGMNQIYPNCMSCKKQYPRI